jgi:hypothetical protein
MPELVVSLPLSLSLLLLLLLLALRTTADGGTWPSPV